MEAGLGLGFGPKRRLAAAASQFTDDFVGTDGVLLQSHSTGWTKAFGAADLVLGSNKLRSNGNGSASNKCLYLRPDDGVALQHVKADLLNTFRAWAMVLASGGGGGPLTGYALAGQSATQVRVVRWINGVNTGALGTANITVPNLLGLELRVTSTTGLTELDVLQNGSVIGTYSDTSGSRLTSGRRGLWYDGNAAGLFDFMDSYADNGVAS